LLPEATNKKPASRRAART